MSEENLLLPEDLDEKRTVLEAETKKVALAIMERDLIPSINALFEMVSLDSVHRLSWKFEYESDDEGDKEWVIDFIQAFDEKGYEIDLDAYTFERKKWPLNIAYTVYVEQDLRDMLADYMKDLIAYKVEGLKLR